MGTSTGLCVDLHTHTNLSDGHLSPRALVSAAAGAGVEVLAITDHDTTEAISEATEEVPKATIRRIS